jgi:hydroxymethylbilane synthase
VHSLKDLPVAPEPGLDVAAIPVREDPRDALVARDGLTLGELPSGSVVGTGSPRRAAQLAALGLGLQMRSIRGNVGTRLGLVEDGTCDAIVLARAGLARLGQLDVVTEVLDPLQMLNAPGQGALAVEVRADDHAMVSAVAALDDADTRASVTAERAVLAALEAGCTAPVGVLAEVSEGEAGETELSIRAFVGAEDGSMSLRRSITGPTSRARALGAQLAALLLEDGADQITALHDGPRPGDPPTEPPGAGDPDRPPAASTTDTPATPTRPDQPAPERAQ